MFMRTRRTVLLAIFLTALVMGAGALDADACQCYAPTECQAYSEARSVFVGKLLSTKKDEDGIYTIAEFEVEKAFKGEIGKVAEVRLLIGSCEMDLRIGESHIVFDQPGISTCNLTGPAEKRASTLRYLEDLDPDKPTFTISGRIVGLSDIESEDTRVFVEDSGLKKEVPLQEYGYFSYEGSAKGEFFVHVVFPRAFEMHIEEFGFVQTHWGNDVRYPVTYRPNECDHRTIQVFGESNPSVSPVSMFSLLPQVRSGYRIWEYTMKHTSLACPV